MSALADALVAAQRRALAAIEKVYVHEGSDPDEFREALDRIGCTDKVEQEQLLAALDVLRTTGVGVPAEPKPAQDNGTAPASDSQLALIAGTYDPAAYTVPF